MTISDKIDKLLSWWLNQDDAFSQYKKDEKAIVENINVYEDNEGELYSYKEKEMKMKNERI
jgi:hypothetical protein